MIKYSDFLKQQRERTAKVHSYEKPVRSITDSWSIKASLSKSKEVKPQYSAMKERLDQLNFYEPVFVNEFSPRDKIDRRYWLEHLSLPFPVKIYTHHHGNYFGNFVFIWKIDEDLKHGDGDLEAIDVVREGLPMFSTRAMRREFINRYTSAGSQYKPAILRDVFRFLTQDSSSAESSQLSEVDERVCEFLLTADETNLFYDLRKLNGRPRDENLNPFWDELQRYLDDVSVVHERRHETVTYMPLAISIQSLIDTISKRLPPGSSCPSTSWLRLNFWPANAFTRSAMCYTGRFNVQYSVQQRLLRSKHPDSEYAFKQFTLMKEMAVLLKDKAELICLDDKSVVPVGEPGNHVASSVRAHNKSLVPTGVKIAALDHDFHIHGAVPSVLFHIDIPTSSSDSFYSGKIHVTVKDKVFQPSSAMRHTAESTKVLRSVASSEDDVNLTKPILFVYTDGGPDHRTTYFSVQMDYIALFMALDWDLLVAARTAPCQSYNNPAERCMSLLNMALQHTSFQRSKMTDGFEMRVKSLSSMKKVRDAAKRESPLKEGMVGSLEPVIAELKQRFSQLKLHDENVVTHDAATDDEIEHITNILDIFKEENHSEEPVITSLKSKKDIKKFDKLKDFIDHHCRERQYTFQIMTCHSECWYCTVNPPRLADADFTSLHWLPDPKMTDDGNGFQSFDELYGTITDDSQRPGLIVQQTSSDIDKRNSGVLVSARVRTFIICTECGKRRCVYCKQKITKEMYTCMERLQEELIYNCGNSLLPDGHNFEEILIVRQSLSCASPIEVTYYGAVLQTFQPICFYCGDSEVALNDDITELKKNYSIVRPICSTCLDNGKRPAVRNVLKVGRKRKH